MYKHDQANFHSDHQIIVEALSGTQPTYKKYAKGRLLGKGGFAKCYEVTSLETNRRYAAKVIQKISLNKAKAKQKVSIFIKQLTSEIKIHRSLKHQNIVGFEHFFEDSQNVYILLEMCPNQTLNQLLKRRKRLTQIQAQYYLHQIIQAVHYIHTQKVIHRDLKLGNLFLSDKLEIKIGDFGLATKINNEGEKRKTMCGTPNYIAPQVLDNKKGHSYEVDAWGVGVIAYAILVGKPPFQTNDVKLTYSRIKSCSYSFPQSVQLSQRSKSFISKLLQLDPSKRLTMKQALTDTFFTWSVIPTVLPISTLACPPNSNFLKQYQTHKDKYNLNDQNSNNKSPKLIEISQLLNSNDQILKSEKKNVISEQKITPFGLHNNKISSIQKNITNDKIFKSRTLSLANLAQLNKGSKLTKCPNNNNNQANQICLITHFQQNPKFGLCYLLNSNSIGMKFNDSSVLIFNCRFTKISYIELTKKLQEQTKQIYGVNQKLSAPILKKMKIISHYQKQLKLKKSLEEQKITNQIKIKKDKLKFIENNQNNMNHYVIRYYKTTKAIFFWFNNKNIQINFYDSSRILITNKGQNTIFISKSFIKKQFKTNQYNNQIQDIKKRVSYIFKVIQGIKNKKTQEYSQQIHKQNQKKQQINKSSSVTKIDQKKFEDIKVCFSMNKLPIYKTLNDPLKGQL